MSPYHQGIQMGYLKDFQIKIANHDYPAFLRLWEEYCSGDQVEGEDLEHILRAVKASHFAESFGRHVERILPLWKELADPLLAHKTLKLILDLQTTNGEYLRELAYEDLKSHYGDKKDFNEKMRLIGLKTKEQFQGCISHFELLNHMEKGYFVFHTGGWGVGEIIDVSLLREELSLEFDYVSGKKEISFTNAFKTLIPIPKDHFLALRFGSPDLLEQKARENPLEVVRLLLRDLGPKTAGEIKDELCDLVIPTKEWARWWQNARAKIKKDTMIHTPKELRDPFYILTVEVSHEDRLKKVLEDKLDIQTFIQTIYAFMKDFPEVLKNESLKTFLQAKFTEILSTEELSNTEELQIHFFLQDLNGEKESPAIVELLKCFPSIEEIISQIDILSFKKRVMVDTRRQLPNWQDIFLNLLFTIDQNPLRDYLFGELMGSASEEALKTRLEDLSAHPSKNPEMFLWYFQKIITPSASLPFSDPEGRCRFFESLLILLSHVEQAPQQKELVKKIHNLISAGRYLIVRQIMQVTDIHQIQEFLLLATKCHSLTDHDVKILHSLAEVVHPSLVKMRKKSDSSESQVIWMTQEGYQKVQTRIQEIATVETVANAREIETARAHGDLRENMEFKAAREKRDRLQTELKFLSDQLNRAQVITKESISVDEVGVGSVVEYQNGEGKTISYTILGPWEADPDQYILSFQSKLAQAMKGLAVGEKFQFQNEEYAITAIRSFLDNHEKSQPSTAS
jgi:transcription elongation factor GreA-like protein/transcription elongation GreA/GreB family factor